MNIEIWSDFICPFCYIGKRKFEIALEKFPHREQVKITWRSFELSPGTLPKPGQDVYDYLAERKGQSREWAVQAHVHGRVHDPPGQAARLGRTHVCGGQVAVHRRHVLATLVQCPGERHRGVGRHGQDVEGPGRRRSRAHRHAHDRAAVARHQPPVVGGLRDPLGHLRSSPGRDRGDHRVDHRVGGLVVAGGSQENGWVGEEVELHHGGSVPAPPTTGQATYQRPLGFRP